MKVILLDNVIGLGRAGDIKKVKDGYARNYLLPQKLAEVATRAKESYLQKMQERLAKKAQEMFESSMQLKETVEAVELVIEVKAGEEGKLFGSVTNHDISQALAEKGYEIKKNKIVTSHIKTVGMHDIKIKLDEGVTAELSIKVMDPNHPDLVITEEVAEEAAPAEAAVEEAETEAEAVAGEESVVEETEEEVAEAVEEEKAE